MFTGLVEETGKVEKVKESGEGKRVKLEVSDRFTKDLEKGESISISGTCLTVEDFSEAGIEFFLAEETLDKTWFNSLEEGDKVNLEKSLTPEDRMGGHIVQGHVEDTAGILEIEELEEGWNFTFELPEDLEDLIVRKGFIGVEGISLTVTEITGKSFSVTIIPETWNVTNLSDKQEGDQVNIETDVMGRYVQKMMDKRD